MPVNRPLWKEFITKGVVPGWHCPSCKGGYLKLKKDSLNFAKTAEAFAASDEIWFDYDHVRYRFTAFLSCNNDKCKESVTVAGGGDVDAFQDEHGDIGYEDKFHPDFMSPSSHLISIPAGCPEEVLAELRKAFIASWGDFPSALNHVRSSVERLLDFLKEPRTRVSGAGRRTRLSLHERIVNLSKRDKALSDDLLAVKWLGNVGSHSDKVSQDDLFDALDIVEMILDDLFVRHRARVKKLVKVINMKKGPAAKRGKGKKKSG